MHVLKIKRKSSTKSIDEERTTKQSKSDIIYIFQQTSTSELTKSDASSNTIRI